MPGWTSPDRLLPLYRQAAAERDIRFHEFLSETVERGLQHSHRSSV